MYIFKVFSLQKIFMALISFGAINTEETIRLN